MVGESDRPLRARSLAEVYLSFLVTPCLVCGGGSLRGTRSIFESSESADTQAGQMWRVDAVCKECGAEAHAAARIEPPSSECVGGSGSISPSETPSVILDVGQWIVLFRLIERLAEEEAEKIRARELRLGAAACLEEALKFYDDPDNDLPPREAVFCDATAERIRQAPEQFSRQRLLALRVKLPRLSGAETESLKDDERVWWRTLP